ncbi:MAG: NYN domain-containing protein [Leptospiraceae bacterium]|nr:NYN domain-containing protein [Leptospiraceae bacterium]
MVNAYCYIPIDSRNEHRLDGLMEALWESGYIVRSKLGAISGNSYRCNLDVEMALDMLKSAYQLKPDVVVIASGDGDFLPIVNELRQLGVRVEVAAFQDNTAREMILKSSGFIDLGVYYQHYFSQVNQRFLPEEPVEEEISEVSDENNRLDEEQSIAEEDSYETTVYNR